MKANKALKHLAKIEAWMSAVTERYSATSPPIREALHDAKVAVTRAKDAMTLHRSSRTSKHAPVNKSKLLLKATPEPSKPKRRISEEGMKRIIAATKKRWSLKRAEDAKAQGAARTAAPSRRKAAVKSAAMKAAPTKAATKSAGRNRAAKKPATVLVQTAEQTTPQ